MSLEEALKENTAALNRVGDLLEKSNTGRSEALAAAQALSTGTTAGAAADKKSPGRPAGSKNATKDGAAKIPTIEELRTSAAAYLGVDDEAERAARKVVAGKILEKLGDGATKVVEIPEKNRAQAVLWFTTLAKGENVDELADEAGDDLLG